jgi:hypothetical protein
MNNIRIKFTCWVISKAIKMMPKEWQSEKAVKNLIAIGRINVIC